MSRLLARLEALELAISGQFQPCVVIRWVELDGQWRQCADVGATQLMGEPEEDQESFSARVLAQIPAPLRKDTLIVSIRRFSDNTD